MHFWGKSFFHMRSISHWLLFHFWKISNFSFQKPQILVPRKHISFENITKFFAIYVEISAFSNFSKFRFFLKKKQFFSPQKKPSFVRFKDFTKPYYFFRILRQGCYQLVIKEFQVKKVKVGYVMNENPEKAFRRDINSPVEQMIFLRYFRKMKGTSAESVEGA